MTPVLVFSLLVLMSSTSEVSSFINSDGNINNNNFSNNKHGTNYYNSKTRLNYINENDINNSKQNNINDINENSVNNFYRSTRNKWLENRHKNINDISDSGLNENDINYYRDINNNLQPSRQQQQQQQKQHANSYYQHYKHYYQMNSNNPNDKQTPKTITKTMRSTRPPGVKTLTPHTTSTLTSPIKTETKTSSTHFIDNSKILIAAPTTTPSTTATTRTTNLTAATTITFNQTTIRASRKHKKRQRQKSSLPYQHQQQKTSEQDTTSQKNRTKERRTTRRKPTKRNHKQQHAKIHHHHQQQQHYPHDYSKQFKKMMKMKRKLMAMMSTLSRRSLRHMRQIKADLRDVAMAVEQLKNHTSLRNELNDQNRKSWIKRSTTSNAFICPENFVGGGTWSSCYRVPAWKSTWFESNKFCSAAGANMLMLESMKEAYIVDYVIRAHETETLIKKNNSVAGADSESKEEQNRHKFQQRGLESDKPVVQSLQKYWTGGIYVPKYESWFWIYNRIRRSTKPIPNLRWGSGAPNNLLTNHCMAIRRNEDFQWFDEKCTDKNYFICEIDLLQKPLE